MNNTGEIIRTLRKQRRISADTIAAKLGVNRSTFYRYENGDIEKIPYQVLIPIAEVLGVSPVDLLEMNDEQYDHDKKEADLLTFFRRLTDEQRDAILMIVEAMIK